MREWLIVTLIGFEIFASKSSVVCDTLCVGASVPVSKIWKHDAFRFRDENRIASNQQLGFLWSLFERAISRQFLNRTAYDALPPASTLHLCTNVYYIQSILEGEIRVYATTDTTKAIVHIMQSIIHICLSPVEERAPLQGPFKLI